MVDFFWREGCSFIASTPDWRHLKATRFKITAGVVMWGVVVSGVGVTLLQSVQGF
jgi:hypothetical protein